MRVKEHDALCVVYQHAKSCGAQPDDLNIVWTRYRREVNRTMDYRPVVYWYRMVFASTDRARIEEVKSK